MSFELSGHGCSQTAPKHNNTRQPRNTILDIHTHALEYEYLIVTVEQFFQKSSKKLLRHFIIDMIKRIKYVGIVLSF